MKTYAIVNKKNIVPNGNTTKSRYPVAARSGWTGTDFPIKRKLPSREAARAYKRGLSNPQNWAILDLRTNEVVR